MLVILSNMEKLFDKFHRKIEDTPLSFTRSLMEDIDWEYRLNGIRGARGVGKTTLLLQYIKQHLELDGTVLYVSMDDFWFTENRLIELADAFVKQGGQYLFLDEVHKYPDWAQELKNIYDDYSNLKVVFTGSSMLEILNARSDLSRRAVMYTMYGLSYREFLNMTLDMNLPAHNLEQLLKNHRNIAAEINSQLQPLKYWNDYLRNGYYPFFSESLRLYHQRLEEVVNFILEVELPLQRKVDISWVRKLKQLLHIIAESVPFMPNVSKLSERIGINRNTLTSYLYFLEEAHLTHNLYRNANGISRLQKPDKIYLNNTNLQYALAPENVDTGNLRETYMVMQLTPGHLIEYSGKSDFLIDGKYTIEVGGTGKGYQQIEGIENAYIAADGIEYGFGNKIPLWLLGFLY